MEQTPQPIKPKSPRSGIENREQITVSWAEKTIPKELSPELPPRINEDSILVDENHRAFGVFDGMGGHAKGDIASQMARNYVLTHLSAIPNGISVDEARKKTFRNYCWSE